MSLSKLSRFEPTGFPLADLINQAITTRALALDRAAKEIRGLADDDPVYCSKQTVSSWRSGSVTPGPTYRRLIARWLNVPVETVVLLAKKQEEMRAGVVAGDPSPALPGQQAERSAIGTTTGLASMLPVGSHQRADGMHDQDGDEDVNRRDFLRKGVVVAGGGLALPTVQFEDGVTLPDHRSQELTIDALEAYWTLLDHCWHLCNLGQLGSVSGIIERVLPALMGVARERPAVAALTAQYLRLLSVVHTHEFRLAEKLMLNQQAVEYARAGQDATTLVATLWELAVAFKYADQPRNALSAYLEALPSAAKAAPLARSRIYAGAAAALAQQGEGAVAGAYIAKAQDCFPSNPQAESHWQSVDYGVWLLAFYEGSAHLSRNDSSAAEQAFVSYEHHPTAALVPERCRLEILNQRARAAIGGGELERFADCLQRAMSGATAIGSRKRLDEALSIYRDETPRAWRDHPALRSIPEQIRSSTGV